MNKIKRRAIFLDRDGVLNKKPFPHDYVKNFKEFAWNKNAKKLVKEIFSRGFLVVVISNQQGIALGKMTKKFVEDLHRKMNKDLEKTGSSIASFYFCPHCRNDKCKCRKPEPGLFYLAAKELGIDLKNSFMIGDSETDIKAALKSGCKNTILIKSDLIDLEYILKKIQ